MFSFRAIILQASSNIDEDSSYKLAVSKPPNFKLSGALKEKIEILGTNATIVTFSHIGCVLLLDFVHSWNDKWVGYDKKFLCMALLVVLVVCYVATFSFSGLLFYLFTASGQDCSLNTFFIVMILIFAFLFAIVTLHPVSGIILPTSFISLYYTYLCYSGLVSEPKDYACNGLHKHSKAVSTGTLSVGFLTIVLSVVYSTVRARSSTTLLSPPSSPRAGQYSRSH
ncbi:hypothetical protein LguiA_006459 [Lonicera macranthoides]